jgi:hypothetical protein
MEKVVDIMVATPAYGCQLHTDYFNSMLALQEGAIRSGINIDFVTIGNQSLVPKARNSLISYFNYEKKFSHIIFIDADMGISNNCVPKLLSRSVDVIGVPVPLKGYNPDGSPVLNIGNISNMTEDGLAETEHVGNAVLMLSREAVDAVIKVSEEYADDPRYSRGDSISTKQYDVFKIGLKDGHYLPEDYYLCSTLRGLGYKIYIDLTLPVKHNGMHGFVHTEEHLALLREKNNENNDLWKRIKGEEK